VEKKNKLTDSNNHHHHHQQQKKTKQYHTKMNRKPPKPGDEDDHIGHPREEDKPRGSPRRGGCQEHSSMEVEERLLVWKGRLTYPLTSCFQVFPLINWPMASFSTATLFPLIILNI